MTHHVTGRYIDFDGRSHNFSLDSDVADRGYIEDLVEARYPAKKVYINHVGVDHAAREAERKQHNQEERERREQQEERLTSGSSSSSSSSSSGGNPRPAIMGLFDNNDDDDDDDDEGVSGGSILGLLAIGGGLWAFFTFTPLILMLLGGAFGTWIGEFATNQGLIDYREIKEPTSDQRKKATIALALALLCGGYGFVQGTNMQNGWNTPDTIEEVKTK